MWVPLLVHLLPADSVFLCQCSPGCECHLLFVCPSVLTDTSSSLLARMWVPSLVCPLFYLLISLLCHLCLPGCECHLLFILLFACWFLFLSLSLNLPACECCLFFSPVCCLLTSLCFCLLACESFVYCLLTCHTVSAFQDVSVVSECHSLFVCLICWPLCLSLQACKRHSLLTLVAACWSLSCSISLASLWVLLLISPIYRLLIFLLLHLYLPECECCPFLFYSLPTDHAMPLLARMWVLSLVWPICCLLLLTSLLHCHC